MAIFGKKQSDGASEKERQELIGSFQQQIQNQETVLYGVALFFECTSLLLSDDPAVLETYRKQFRNIIQTGRDCAARATALLEKAKEDSKAVAMLEQFKITSCEGHPNPDLMKQRALALVQAYAEAFPSRDKNQPFSEEEIMQLMRTASDKIDLTPQEAAS